VTTVTTRVGLSSDGGVVTVAPGDALEVALPQNASTGYRWEVSPSPGIAVVDDRVETGEAPGATGERVLVLRVREPGEVVARLRRSWEPAEAAAQTFRIRVATGQAAVG
jgi:inhibitor of cysteine peptidase